MEKSHHTGTLFLIPTPIAGDVGDSLPQNVIDKIHRLRYFIGEKARTARRFIKITNPPYAIQDIEVLEMERKTSLQYFKRVLSPLSKGQDIGLMSEAGCPGIADPGSGYVSYCHEHGYKVVPLVGPSSIMLALMASGMNGQSFSFRGYLPAKRNELGNALKQIERDAQKGRTTQIFIEAPYRNQQMMEVAKNSLQPSTKLCMAMNITAPNEWIKCQSISEWKKMILPDIHKQPAIFLIASNK